MCRAFSLAPASQILPSHLIGQKKNKISGWEKKFFKKFSGEAFPSPERYLCSNRKEARDKPEPQFHFSFFLTDRWQKCFRHQAHTQAKSISERLALGDAVHLVAAVLILLQRFLLLFCQRSIQFLAVPDHQFHQLLELLVNTIALLEGRDVAVPEFLADVLP